jgi:hypothetical protein
MTKKQGAAKIVHGMHAKKHGNTKCGLRAYRLPDGNHRVVNTNAIGQITCKACLRRNIPGIC